MQIRDEDILPSLVPLFPRLDAASAGVPFLHADEEEEPTSSEPLKRFTSQRLSVLSPRPLLVDALKKEDLDVGSNVRPARAPSFILLWFYYN